MNWNLSVFFLGILDFKEMVITDNLCLPLCRNNVEAIQLIYLKHAKPHILGQTKCTRKELENIGNLTKGSV